MSVEDIYLHQLVRELRQRGVSFEKGLDAKEIALAENEYDFKFPPDLRDFLKVSMPVSREFPNWRTGLIKGASQITPIRDRVAWPAVGICFDIENSDFWWKPWGVKPQDLKVALKLAKEKLCEAPKLVPIYSHRYIPSQPAETGNPIFSVHQTDIIYYGSDLPSYFAREFGVTCPSWSAKEPRRIPFWGTLASSEDD